jgi:hypothetical protein
MISRRWHSRTASLLALVYLLATTIGGLFHDHGAHDHSAHDRGAHDRGAHDHSAHDHSAHDRGAHEHGERADVPQGHDQGAVVAERVLRAAGFDDGALTRAAVPTVSGLPSTDDDCVVCRFLAQKPPPVQVATVAVSCDFVACLPAPAVHGPAAPVARTLHSRAPPALA